MHSNRHKYAVWERLSILFYIIHSTEKGNHFREKRKEKKMKERNRDSIAMAIAGIAHKHHLLEHRVTAHLRLGRLPRWSVCVCVPLYIHLVHVWASGFTLQITMKFINIELFSAVFLHNKQKLANVTVLKRRQVRVRLISLNRPR